MLTMLVLGFNLLATPGFFDLEWKDGHLFGTVIDVLSARSPVPILVVRKPYEPKGDLFRQVLMILTTENEAASPAAAWASCT